MVGRFVVDKDHDSTISCCIHTLFWNWRHVALSFEVSNVIRSRRKVSFLSAPQSSEHQYQDRVVVGWMVNFQRCNSTRMVETICSVSMGLESPGYQFQGIVWLHPIGPNSRHLESVRSMRWAVG